MPSSANLPVLRSRHQIERNEWLEALVVFVGHTQCRCLHWLKQGFKHCFVALRMADKWIICDSLKNRIELSLLELPSDFSLRGFYLERGYTVMAGHVSHIGQPIAMTLEILTCVSVVKCIVGLRSLWTVTPWQLFCHLNAMGDRWHLVE